MTGANFFEEVNQYFDQAACFTDYPPGLLSQIRIVLHSYDSSVGVGVRFRVLLPSVSDIDLGFP